jgi:hypothetical protein
VNSDGITGHFLGYHFFVRFNHSRIQKQQHTKYVGQKNTNIKYNYTNLVLINVCFSFVFSIQDVLNILGHCPIASPPFSLRRWMNVVRGTTKTLGLLDSLAEERSSRFQPKNGGQNPDTVGTPKKSCLMDVYSPSGLTHPQVINMMKQDWQF